MKQNQNPLSFEDILESLAEGVAKAADRLIVPVSSGFIAGVSLVGVLLAALVVFGFMQ